MRRLETSTAFRRDAKLLLRRGKDLGKLQEVVDRLQVGEKLDARHRDHALGGPWKGYRDCHIEPDWVLIYEISGEWLRLVRTGTHSDFLE